MMRGLVGGTGRKNDDGPCLRLCPTQFISVRCGIDSGAFSRSIALTCPFSIRLDSANRRLASSPTGCVKYVSPPTK